MEIIYFFFCLYERSEAILKIFTRLLRHFTPRNDFSIILIYVSNNSTSSSSVLLFRWVFQHCLHWKCILSCQFLNSYFVGYIIHPQVVALSPGMSPSTWREIKQYGQWFLQVFAAWETAFPQWIHLKDSFIFFINFG